MQLNSYTKHFWDLLLLKLLHENLDSLKRQSFISSNQMGPHNGPQLSMFRKIMRMGNWMEPLHLLLHSVPVRILRSRNIKANILTHDVLDAVIELYNAIFDDIYLFFKLGLVLRTGQNSATRQTYTLIMPGLLPLHSHFWRAF